MGGYRFFGTETKFGVVPISMFSYVTLGSANTKSMGKVNL